MIPLDLPYGGIKVEHVHEPWALSRQNRPNLILEEARWRALIANPRCRLVLAYFFETMCNYLWPPKIGGVHHQESTLPKDSRPLKCDRRHSQMLNAVAS